ncbi:hypothetical protein Scep_011663 [Stephania cephalantha]|uniref:Uncharacterized protein n=1 Tax=Stephania cephalantha TaxID=152367 RepID=A0AAP0JFQ6_9MAGN
MIGPSTNFRSRASGSLGLPPRRTLERRNQPNYPSWAIGNHHNRRRYRPDVNHPHSARDGPTRMINLGGLADQVDQECGGGNLGANVEMRKLKATKHSFRLKPLRDAQYMRRHEPKLALLVGSRPKMIGVLGPRAALIPITDRTPIFQARFRQPIRSPPLVRAQSQYKIEMDIHMEQEVLLERINIVLRSNIRGE